MARGKFQVSTGDNDHRHQLPSSADDLPDTVSVNLDDKDPNAFQIVEVDDTPAADRGRDTVWNGPSSLEEQEDDLRNLSKREFEKRLKRVVAETNTERRAREQVERERDAAVELASRQNAEITRLRQTTATGNTALVNSMTSEREARIADASRRLEQAHLEGNGAAIAKATVDLGQAQAELIAIRTRAPAPPVDAPVPQVAPVPQQQRLNIAPRAQAWVDRNRGWFRATGGDPKSDKALSLHYDLVARGVNPDSEAYTRALDKGLKAVYPEHVEYDYPSPDGDRQERSTPRRSNTVADSSRENESAPANPRTVELTRSELSLAKRLNITPQAYAAEKLKYAAKLRGAQ